MDLDLMDSRSCLLASVTIQNTSFIHEIHTSRRAYKPEMNDDLGPFLPDVQSTQHCGAN